MGLTNPSGGGGVNAELIVSICDTNVGSFEIQLPTPPPAMPLPPASRESLRQELAECQKRRAELQGKSRTADAARDQEQQGYGLWASMRDSET